MKNNSLLIVIGMLLIIMAVDAASTSYQPPTATIICTVSSQMEDSGLSRSFDLTEPHFLMPEVRSLIYHFGGFYDGNVSEVIDVYEQNCLEDIGSAREGIEAGLNAWISDEKDMFSNEYLEILPASGNRAYYQEIKEKTRSIESCYYLDIKYEGDFLIVNNRLKEYCYISDGSFFSSAGAQTNSIDLLVYIFRNPSMSNIFYLLQHVMIAGLLVFGIMFGFNRIMAIKEKKTIEK
ncbi:MAG: hypothetical protein ABIH34_01280 [Nanoarchaeota archaeon]